VIQPENQNWTCYQIAVSNSFISTPAEVEEHCNACSNDGNCDGDFNFSSWPERQIVFPNIQYVLHNNVGCAVDNENLEEIMCQFKKSLQPSHSTKAAIKLKVSFFLKTLLASTLAAMVEFVSLRML
jgi:hypothetical protein